MNKPTTIEADIKLNEQFSRSKEDVIFFTAHDTNCLFIKPKEEETSCAIA